MPRSSVGKESVILAEAVLCVEFERIGLLTAENPVALQDGTSSHEGAESSPLSFRTIMVEALCLDDAERCALHRSAMFESLRVILKSELDW